MRLLVAVHVKQNLSSVVIFELRTAQVCHNYKSENKFCLHVQRLIMFDVFLL